MASVPQKLQDESFNHLFTHHEHLVISMSYKLVLKRECRNIQKSLQSDITKPELPGHFPGNYAGSILNTILSLNAGRGVFISLFMAIEGRQVLLHQSES